MEPDLPSCARHPGTPTRLSCSACETAICPDCLIESAVGYKCPDCGTHGGSAPRSEREGSGLAGVLGSLRAGSSEGSRGVDAGSDGGAGVPATLAVRAVSVGLAAAVAGGLVLGLVFAGRTFFLISAGLIGWAIARAVYWATEERNSPVVRGAALGLPAVAVIVGMTTAPGTMGPPDPLLYLALPAAMYGAWITVRQR